VALERPAPHAVQDEVVATPASAVVTPPLMPNTPVTATQAAPEPLATHDDAPLPDAIAATPASAVVTPPLMPNMPATATQAAPEPSATHVDTPAPDAIAVTHAPAAAKVEQPRDAAPPVMPDVPATRARSAPEPLVRPIDARLPDAVAPITNSAPVGAMAGQTPHSASLAAMVAPVAPVEPIAVQDTATLDTAVLAPASSNIAPSRAAPAASQAARGAVFIQVGAFHEADRAEKLCGGLAAKGYELAVAAQPSKTGRNWYICRSTAAADRAEAAALAARLRDKEKTPALLVPADPSATTPN